MELLNQFMNKIEIAKQIAYKAHDGVLRKFTNRPYVEHCERVANSVAKHPGTTEAQVCIAWIHDVLEDNPDMFSYTDICNLLGKEIADGAKLLVNPSKEHKNLKRAQRKAMDREHIQQLPVEIKLIKAYDRLDNVKDIPPGEQFGTVYANESLLLLECLEGVDPIVLMELKKAILTLKDLCNHGTNISVS